MTTVETLRAARELIADPERWCQEVAARGKSGRPVDPTGRAAVAWCAIGACRRIARRDADFVAAFDRLGRAAFAVDVAHPGVFNDTHDHAEVMAMFDRAIREAEDDR